MTFKPVMQAETIDKDGVHSSLTTYTASDGSSLTVNYSYFVSEGAAQEYFEKVLNKDATKIKERGKKKDKKGKVVGERAEVIVLIGSGDQTTPAIMLTFGPHFYEFMGGSSRARLAIEMKLTSSN